MSAEIGVGYCAVPGKFVLAEYAVQSDEFLHGVVGDG